VLARAKKSRRNRQTIVTSHFCAFSTRFLTRALGANVALVARRRAQSRLAAFLQKICGNLFCAGAHKTGGQKLARAKIRH